LHCGAKQHRVKVNCRQALDKYMLNQKHEQKTNKQKTNKEVMIILIIVIIIIKITVTVYYKK
jgi:hypothetical protein